MIRRSSAYQACVICGKRIRSPKRGLASELHMPTVVNILYVLPGPLRPAGL